MLLETHCRFPTKAFCETLRVDIVTARQLKISEQFLKLIRDTIIFVPMDLFIIAPRIDNLAKLGSHIQRLKQTVHVASGSLIR